jgi:hypothetical protein
MARLERRTGLIERGEAGTARTARRMSGSKAPPCATEQHSCCCSREWWDLAQPCGSSGTSGRAKHGHGRIDGSGQISRSPIPAATARTSHALAHYGTLLTGQYEDWRPNLGDSIRTTLRCTRTRRLSIGRGPARSPIQGDDKRLQEFELAVDPRVRLAQLTLR